MVQDELPLGNPSPRRPSSTSVLTFHMLAMALRATGRSLSGHLRTRHTERLRMIISRLVQRGHDGEKATSGRVHLVVIGV